MHALQNTTDMGAVDDRLQQLQALDMPFEIPSYSMELSLHNPAVEEETQQSTTRRDARSRQSSFTRQVPGHRPQNEIAPHANATMAPAFLPSYTYRVSDEVGAPPLQLVHSELSSFHEDIHHLSVPYMPGSSSISYPQWTLDGPQRLANKEGSKNRGRAMTGRHSRRQNARIVEEEKEDREKLTEDGCPPCLPEHCRYRYPYDTEERIPYRYPAAMFYLRGDIAVHDKPLQAQLFDWTEFRQTQSSTRKQFHGTEDTGKLSDLSEAADNKPAENEVGENELGKNELDDNELNDNKLDDNELDDNERGDNKLERRIETTGRERTLDTHPTDIFWADVELKVYMERNRRLMHQRGWKDSANMIDWSLDVTRQSQLQNWLEFMAYHLDHDLALRRGAERRLREVVGEDNRLWQKRSDDKRIQIHDKFLTWMEEQRVKMSDRNAGPKTDDGSDENQD